MQQGVGRRMLRGQERGHTRAKYVQRIATGRKVVQGISRGRAAMRRQEARDRNRTPSDPHKERRGGPEEADQERSPKRPKGSPRAKEIGKGTRRQQEGEREATSRTGREAGQGSRRGENEGKQEDQCSGLGQGGVQQREWRNKPTSPATPRAGSRNAAAGRQANKTEGRATAEKAST